MRKFSERRRTGENAPPKPDDFPVTLTREEMLAEENLPKGVLYAVIACIVGAAAWGLIFCFYRLSDRIYGYRYRFSGGFRHAAGKRDTSCFWNNRRNAGFT